MARTLAIVLVLWPLGALAHDHGLGAWINQGQLKDPASGESCCNLHDCQAERVREVVGGYSTEGGDVVPYSRVLWKSQDGQWWRCRYLSGEKVNKTRCLIGPPPGT